MLIALASVVSLIEIRLQIPWRRRVGQLIVLMFVISVPWTWYELYKVRKVVDSHKDCFRDHFNFNSKMNYALAKVLFRSLPHNPEF